jgi:hypothetical protein
VRSVDRVVSHGKNGRQKRKGQVLKLGLDKRGYPKVAITKDGKNLNRNIHRLVALAFIPNPENKPQVNHIDGDKTNNEVDNLEWNTAQENMIHAVKTGLFGDRKGIKNGQSKVTLELIQKAREMRASGHTYKSIGQAIGVCRQQATRILTGQRWKHL